LPRITDALGGVAEGTAVMVTVDNAVVSDAGTSSGAVDAGAAAGVSAPAGCSSAGAQPLAAIAAALVVFARRHRARRGTVTSPG
jgi:hypothetical protein